MTELEQAVGSVIGLILAGAFILYLGASTPLSGASGFGNTLFVGGVLLGIALVAGLVTVGVNQ